MGAYELTQSHSEETAYGYVLRDSDAHKALTEGLSQGPKRMILRLQASKGFAALRAFVIKDLISDSIYRIEPPSSLDDRAKVMELTIPWRSVAGSNVESELDHIAILDRVVFALDAQLAHIACGGF
jgi:hypothetical protein